jgi:hypothetical protein
LVAFHSSLITFVGGKVAFIGVTIALRANLVSPVTGSVSALASTVALVGGMVAPVGGMVALLTCRGTPVRGRELARDTARFPPTVPTTHYRTARNQ